MVMIPRSEAPDWTRAKCRAHPASPDLDTFFGERDGRIATELLDRAAAICNGDDDRVICPLRHQCLTFALSNRESSGMWGGMHEDDRKYARNHLAPEDWIWRPPFDPDLKARGAQARAHRWRAA